MDDRPDLDLPSMDHSAWGQSPGAGYAAPGQVPGQTTVGVQPRRSYTPERKALVTIEVYLGGADGGMGPPVDPDVLQAKRTLSVPFYLCEDEERGAAFYQRVGLLGQLVKDVVGARGAFEAELERKGVTPAGAPDRPFDEGELESMRAAWQKRLDSDFHSDGRFEVAVEGDTVVCRPQCRKLGEDELRCAICRRPIAPNEERHGDEGHEHCHRCESWQRDKLPRAGEEREHCCFCDADITDEPVVYYQGDEGPWCPACELRRTSDAERDALEAREDADGPVCPRCGRLCGEDVMRETRDGDRVCEDCFDYGDGEYDHGDGDGDD